MDLTNLGMMIQQYARCTTVPMPWTDWLHLALFALLLPGVGAAVQPRQPWQAIQAGESGIAFNHDHPMISESVSVTPGLSA